MIIVITKDTTQDWAKEETHRARSGRVPNVSSGCVTLLVHRGDSPTRGAHWSCRYPEFVSGPHYVGVIDGVMGHVSEFNPSSPSFPRSEAFSLKSPSNHVVGLYSNASPSSEPKDHHEPLH